MFFLERLPKIKEAGDTDELINDFGPRAEMACHRRRATGRINHEVGGDLEWPPIPVLGGKEPTAGLRAADGAIGAFQKHRAAGLAHLQRQHPIEPAAIEMPSFSATSKEKFLPENLITAPGRRGGMRGPMTITDEFLPKTEINEQRPKAGANRLSHSRRGIIPALQHGDAQIAVAAQGEGASRPGRPAPHHRHVNLHP